MRMVTSYAYDDVMKRGTTWYSVSPNFVPSSYVELPEVTPDSLVKVGGCSWKLHEPPAMGDQLQPSSFSGKLPHRAHLKEASRLGSTNDAVHASFKKQYDDGNVNVTKHSDTQYLVNLVIRLSTYRLVEHASRCVLVGMPQGGHVPHDTVSPPRGLGYQA